MEANEYQCAVCHGVFEKGWSDAEADEEARDLWGVEQASAASESSMVMICDDCFARCSGDEIRRMGQDYQAWQSMGATMLVRESDVHPIAQRIITSLQAQGLDAFRPGNSYDISRQVYQTIVAVLAEGLRLPEDV